MQEVDLNIKVKFRGSEYVLKDVLDLCQPGETIENIPFECMNSLLYLFREKRGKEYTYSTDRRYGKWRFILFGEREN